MIIPDPHHSSFEDAFPDNKTETDDGRQNTPSVAEHAPISDGSLYNVFRKTFHVPNAWLERPVFKALVEHQYLTQNAKEVFTFIKGSLQELGYADDNDMMVHDYLHHMICEFLDAEGVPYVTEDDIRKNNELLTLFDNLTPDLIIKSDPLNGRPKPLILDVYIGKNEKSIQEKKSKYKALGVVFDFVGVARNFSAPLLQNNILPQNYVDYLFKQFQIFLTEYHYWRACLKVGKILFNDCENQALMEMHIDIEGVEGKRQQFLKGLLKKAAEMTDRSEI